MNLIEPSFDPTVFTKNRVRLLKHRVGQALFDEVVLEADQKGLLSDEHFTVDGTLIEAAASPKSFKPKDGDPPKTTDDDPGNPSVDFHGKRCSNATNVCSTVVTFGSTEMVTDKSTGVANALTPNAANVDLFPSKSRSGSLSDSVGEVWGGTTG